MSNQPGNTQNNTPLFQNMDEQEAVYATQQPSSGTMVGGEVQSDPKTDDSPLLSGLVPVAPAVGGMGGATGGVVGGGGAAPIVPEDPTQREFDDDTNLGDSARR